MIGPNGAGKSTCFNMINGQLTARRRQIIRSGDRSIVGLAPREIWRLGVGRTFQVAATFGSMTVVENVQLALVSHHGEILPLRQAAFDTASRRARSELLDAGRHGAKPPIAPCNELAYGDVKRVELAIALANEPRLLLMDEPTAGMAPRERNDLHRAGQAAGGRAQDFRAVHRALDGRGVRLCRPHHRAGARAR